MAVVGIIPNPASGKDIRRVVALGLVMSNRDKVNLLRRLLIGLHAAGVSSVKIMPDLFGIGQDAIDGLLHSDGQIVSGVSIMNMPVTGTGQDTVLATELLREEHVDCIITLGGDGTVRLVGNNCGDIPILPISTGTNNVLPTIIDGTIAGLCAGFFIHLAQEQRTRLCYRCKRLDIEINGKVIDSALVDVAVLEGTFVGSKAVWQPETIRQLFVTMASPATIGLSAIIGMLRPISIDDPFGATLELGSADSPQTVMATIGPGLVSKIPFSDITILRAGVRSPITEIRPLVFALDGEREIVLSQGDDAAVYLFANGPWIIAVEPVMKRAVENDYFIRN